MYKLYELGSLRGTWRELEKDKCFSKEMYCISLINGHSNNQNGQTKI
jgi:hypothetical protein